MKVTIQTTAPQSRKIDWSKPMVVTDGKIYVRTNGEYSLKCFAGTCLSSFGYFSLWAKELFTPCTVPITVTFENEL